MLPANPPTEVDAQLLAELGAAADVRPRVAFTHHSYRGVRTTREVDPYGLVFHSRCWYLVGHDHLRAALRTFRVDRIRDLTVTDRRFTRPEDFDAVEALVHALATVPYPIDVVVVLHTGVQEARRRVGATIATVEPHEDGALVRMGADSLTWAARYLVDLAVPFTIVSPDDLREALRELARQLVEIADR